MEKGKALDAALSQIERSFGKGSIMRMDAEAVRDVQVVSTGSPARPRTSSSPPTATSMVILTPIPSASTIR